MTIRMRANPIEEAIVEDQSVNTGMSEHSADLRELTAEVVSAYVSNNSVPMSELPSLISQVHSALGSTQGEAAAAQPAERPKPAVPVKKSVTEDYIICLEDGKQFKSLKRHLSSKYDMTPEEYRQRWNLPPDYPMVAPAYAAARSKLAREMGLGRKAKTPAKGTTSRATKK